MVKLDTKLAFRPKSVQLVKITLLSSSTFLRTLTVSLPPTHREEYKGLLSEWSVSFIYNHLEIMWWCCSLLRKNTALNRNISACRPIKNVWLCKHKLKGLNFFPVTLLKLMLWSVSVWMKSVWAARVPTLYQIIANVCRYSTLLPEVHHCHTDFRYNVSHKTRKRKLCFVKWLNIKYLF